MPDAAEPRRGAGVPPSLSLARSLGYLAVCWIVVRVIQTTVVAGGFGNDVNGYFEYATAWAQGRKPYADFQVEYPPGALPLFFAPLLIGGPTAYVAAFVREMAAFDLSLLLIVFLWARRLWAEAPRRQWIVAAAYLCATTILYPVLYARFDLAPAALTLAAAYLAYTPAAWAGALLLGFAGAIKLWPLALAPLLLLVAMRRPERRAVIVAAACLVIGFAAPFALFVPAAGWKVASFLEFQGARGLQLESTWASLAQLIEAMSLGAARRVARYGAYDLTCPACPSMVAISAPALLILVVAPQALALRRGLGQAEDARGAVGMRAMAAAVLGFIVGAKVLSPQFLLWMMPFVLVVGRGFDIAAVLVVSLLTTAIYPFLYPVLLDRRLAGHGVALACLLVRNALLVVLYARLLLRIGQPQRGPAP